MFAQTFHLYLLARSCHFNFSNWVTSDVAFLEHRVASVEPYGSLMNAAADAEQIMDGLQDDVDMRVEAHQIDLEAAGVLVPWKPPEEKTKGYVRWGIPHMDKMRLAKDNKRLKVLHDKSKEVEANATLRNSMIAASMPAAAKIWNLPMHMVGRCKHLEIKHFAVLPKVSHLRLSEVLVVGVCRKPLCSADNHFPTTGRVA